MLRSTADPVNPTRTVFDVKKLRESLNYRADAHKRQGDKMEAAGRPELAAKLYIREELFRGLIDRIDEGEYDTKVEEVPAPEPCGCLDKVKITDRIMNRIEREQMWEKQHADNYVYLQAGVCRENARTLTKLLQEINEGDFDHTSCKPEPVLTRPALDKEDVLNLLEKAVKCVYWAEVLLKYPGATYTERLKEIIQAIKDGHLDVGANQ